MNTGKRRQTDVKIEIVIQMAKDRYFEYKYMLLLFFSTNQTFLNAKYLMCISNKYNRSDKSTHFN